MKKLVLALTALFLITGIAIGKETPKEKRKAREKAKIEAVQKLFNDRSIEFLAESAQPMTGGVLHLTSDYTLDINNNLVTAFLPFYGVAYNAEYGGGEGGIKFSETAFSSDWQTSRKGYDIRMEVKAPKDTYILHLSISGLGYANLNITCQNRQPINFSGIIQALPVKNK